MNPSSPNLDSNGGDIGGGGGFGSDDGFDEFEQSKVRIKQQLPADLPKSLDDRRMVTDAYTPETEIYDAWQGQSQFLTAPVLAKPLQFNNLSLDDPDHDFDANLASLNTRTARGSDAADERIMEMMAARAAQQDGNIDEDEDTILESSTLTDEEKRERLQRILHMAASNGDAERVERLVKGRARTWVDLDKGDEEGTAPLIYAACFGHDEVVRTLLAAGASPDIQDRNQWSALIWAMTNRHKSVAKTLLDHGASPEVKSSSGRTAFDFAAPDSEMTSYLSSSGYAIGNAGVLASADDFYNPGFGADRFEEELAEQEIRRRMMMESARDLEVDLGNVGMDDTPESAEEIFEEEAIDFDWSRCLHDQMFVFQERDLEKILDICVTTMTPQRSPTQKPVPANMIFLCARYAHYHSSPELLGKLLVSAMDRINDVVETHQWDMTILAFWISNATLLLHYLKKDMGLSTASSEFQLQLAELVNEIFILIIRDAERRIDKVLDAGILDHETIPGFEDIAFQDEWKLFKRKAKVEEESPEKRFRPPSPKARAKPSPRNVTSLLSSTLFVLDLYDIHSVITSQILSQLFYWISAELFNRIMSSRRYLARTKAMQIRMNISILEDWARTNNRVPEHYENGSMEARGETTVDAARRHLAPVIQLLQWLQCFSSLGEDDLEGLVGTLQQLKRLSIEQLVHTVKQYRAEVGEKGLPKSAMKYLLNLQRETATKKLARKSLVSQSVPSTPIRPSYEGAVATPMSARPPDTEGGGNGNGLEKDEEEPKEGLLLDPALMLPFHLPTSTDMLVSFGAGFGGVNRERERKYIPTVPPEFLSRLE